MKTNQLTARLITLFVFSHLTFPAGAQIPVFPSNVIAQPVPPPVLTNPNFRPSNPAPALFVPPIPMNKYPDLVPNLSIPIPGNMNPMTHPNIETLLLSLDAGLRSLLR